MQSFSGDKPTFAPSWQQRLDLAASEADVLAVAREFLAMFTPYEIDRLPPPCHPPLKLVDREDIASYAYDLMRHECAQDSESAELVHKLAHFFSHASMRIAQLTSRVPLEQGQRHSA